MNKNDEKRKMESTVSEDDIVNCNLGTVSFPTERIKQEEIGTVKKVIKFVRKESGIWWWLKGKTQNILKEN